MSLVVAGGSDYRLFLQEGVSPTFTYRPIVQQTSAALEDNSSTREGTAKGQAGVRRDYVREDYSFTCESNINEYGTADVGSLSIEEIEDFRRAKTKPILVLCKVDANGDPDLTVRAYRATVVIGPMPKQFPEDGDATTSLSFPHDGEMEYLDPA